MRGALVIICSSLGAGAALACPVCDSEQGKQVRAGLFDESFASNLVRTAAPFPVLFAGVALLYRILPEPRARRNGEP